jgi:streptogramin lyase
MNKYRYWGMISLLGAGLALTLAGCGGGGGGGSTAVGNDTSYTSSAVVTTIAGTGGTGIVNGTGTTEPTFNGPTGIALGTVGTTTYLYIADTGNKAIRRINLASMDVVTATINGALIGSATLTLSAPKGVACDSNGYFYVTDSTTIYKINSNLTSLATVNSASNNVTGIVYYDTNTFYVADYASHVICSVVNATGGARSVVAGSEGVSGSTNTTNGKFTNPYGVTTDGNGNLYVADYGNSAIRKVVISSGKVTTLAGMLGTTGSKDGTGTTARFNHPTGIAYYSGALYVADTDNHIIRKVVIPTTDPSDDDDETAVVTTVAGYKGYAGFANGTIGNAAKFSSPTGIVSDGNGTLYVADKGNNRIRMIDITSL